MSINLHNLSRATLLAVVQEARETGRLPDDARIAETDYQVRQARILEAMSRLRERQDAALLAYRQLVEGRYGR